MWFYLNGEFVEDDDAKVSVTDRAFVYGDGCFEGLGIFNGRIPHLDDHVDRLFRSARMLRLDIPVSPARMRDLILETASRNGMDTMDSAYLRPLITRGAGPLGVKNSATIGPSTVVIIPQMAGRRAEFGDEPQICRAVITRFARAAASTLNPAIKSNNYLTSVLAFLEAQDHDPEADVAIVHDQQGFLSEGHAMNVFCVTGGVVYTPPASVALRGITRAHVIGLAKGLGIEVLEGNLTDYDLICADEAFVTSSMESVAPIGAVNSRPLPGPVPGPVTARLRAAYLEHAWETATPIPAQASRGDASAEKVAGSAL